jgi:hypothetical protein
MRFIEFNVALATWMLISAFALPQTPTSAVVTAAGAFLVPVIALFAGARPGVRYIITVLALVLAGAMLLMPDVSAAARISNWIVAALFFALSFVSPHHGVHAPAH